MSKFLNSWKNSFSVNIIYINEMSMVKYLLFNFKIYNFTELNEW